MKKTAWLLVVLLISAVIISLGSLSIGAAATQPSDSESGNPPAADAELEASVRCLPFGICGSITAETMVDGLTEDGDKLVFVGTSNGLYVLGLDGELQHFLYSPFGVRFVALIDDITGDGSREVVVVLNDTQVPALRCYDGATWEKLWQFAPMTKIWDQLWVKRQMGIGDLEVINDGDSQSVVITSGQSVFSVDAEDGTENWRSRASSGLSSMVTVTDLNGDGADEVFAGSDDGQLFLLSGNSGDPRWRTKLPAISANGCEPTMVNDIVTLDREAGRVAVVSTDGLARLFDLGNRTCEWAVPVSDDSISGWRIALAPDVTSDRLPGILVNYASSYSNASSEEEVVLFDFSGEKQWDKKLYVWHDSGVEVGSFGGKPVILEPKNQELRLIDLKDGETVVKTISVSTLDGQAPMVRQVGETSFLLLSSGSDLAVVSAEGETQGNYPRVANVKAKGGHFVGDATEDTLFSCEWKSTSQYGYTPPVNDGGINVATAGAMYQPQAAEPEVRMLKVMDGATGEIAWSYEVPLNDLKSTGGLKGIEIAADLVGNDGIQDIIGYREDRVFIFSGKDGTLSPRIQVGQPIASLDVIRNRASGNVIAVSTAGTEIWTTAGEEWVEDETVKFMVLDDLNSDNVSDLAVLSAAKIVLLGSTDNTTGYELHLTFRPETDSLIEYVEVVPDANGDGVREIAYIQRNPGSQQPDKYTPPGCPLLLEKSPVDAKELLRLVLPASYPAVDLACGDFDGDGCADSLICQSSYDACGDTSSDPSSYVHNPGKELRIVSGKSSETVWKHALEPGHSVSGGWNASPPATPCRRCERRWERRPGLDR